jgi:hypothetical protein
MHPIKAGIRMRNVVIKIRTCNPNLLLYNPVLDSYQVIIGKIAGFCKPRINLDRDNDAFSINAPLPKIVIHVFALLCASCTSIEYRDRIIYETVEVPVPISCIKSVPDRVMLEPAGETDFAKIRAIVIDRDNLLTQQERLLALLTACL